MSSTINASTAGIVETADSSGILELQTGGVTSIYMDASQNVTIPKNLTINGTLTYSGGGSGVTTFSGGTTGFTPSTPTAGAVTLSGTLSYLNGGTGVTSSGATGNLLVSTGAGWASQTPTIAGIVTLANSQTITGDKTFSGSNTFTGGQGFGAANTSSGNWSTYTQANGANPAQVIYTGTTLGAAGAFYVNNSYANTATIQLFGLGTPSSNTLIGAINVNNTSNGVNYVTTSDRRLKTNIADLTGSGEFIDALKPRTFDWINNNTHDTGFIADELQEVIPQAVEGQPNAVDAEGKPVYQMVDSSTPEMIANIVAELQSLRKRVAQLEAK